MAIAIGGVLGATLRWWITDVGGGGGYFTTVDEAGDWFRYSPTTSPAVRTSVVPWGTLAVNLVGTLLLGAALTVRNGSRGSRRVWLAVATGFCGSLTTFSTFAVELAQRFRSSPFDPDPALYIEYGGLTPLASGVLYLGVSLIGAVLAFGMGRTLAKKALA